MVAGVRVGAELRVGAGYPNFLLNERRGEDKIEMDITVNRTVR